MQPMMSEKSKAKNDSVKSDSDSKSKEKEDSQRKATAFGKLVNKISGRLKGSDESLAKKNAIVVKEATLEDIRKSNLIKPSKDGTIDLNQPIQPLEKYHYYHGCVSRYDAEEILLNHSPGNFLIRASRRPGNSLAIVLSIRTTSGISHFEIPVDNFGRFYFNDFAFENLHSLLMYHFKHFYPVTLTTNYCVYLKHAIDRTYWEFDDRQVHLEDTPLGEVIILLVDLIELMMKIEKCCFKQGNFGAVYRGYVDIDGKRQLLAVKTLQDPDNEEGREELLREARVLRKLEHVNITKLIGVTISSGATMVLLEFLNGGSMDNYLKKHQLSPRTKMKLLSDAANGIKYIHSKNVIHRDLAARNCLLLLNEDNHPERVKITDFGLCVEAVQVYRTTDIQCIPVRWSAPETLKDNVWSQKTDVWSFAVIIWEFFNEGSLPYYDIEPFSPIILLKALAGGYCLLSTPEMHPQLVSLMASCLNFDSDERPTMDMVYEKLQVLISSSVHKNKKASA
ncbi:putative kinase domain protein [Trichinella spiralis]|uniref:Tyrosine-protein kinase n=1 Tax=Trichinella spiralis TaxID=6334 RepID=E5SGP0_TRISP|nr:putative kinase domain protein [Trichinella spiralis]KRY41523.1 Tyrosine-protein kinase Fps85D [Trichinella spiralis]